MAEVLCNAVASPLAGAITSADTSLDVVSATGFPTSGDFRIRLDSELLLVTAVSGATFTVTRGIEGTAAAAHRKGALVRGGVLTAGGLAQYVADAAGGGGGPTTLEVDNTGATDLAVGDVVALDGGGSGKVPVARMTSASTSPWLGMVVDAPIPSGASGTIQTSGTVTGLDTSAFSIGDWVFLDTAGGLTWARQAVLHVLGVCLVADATDGAIALLPGQYGVELVGVHSHGETDGASGNGGPLYTAEMAEAAPGGNPPAGTQVLYIDPADHHLKRRQSDGTIVDLG